MFRRRTSRVRKRRQVRELRAHVMSPRIFWFDFRRMTLQSIRWLGIFALLVLASWGAWRGVEAALFENDDFRLQRVVLNDNPAVDEERLLSVTGIDLSGSLFDCDPDVIRDRLLALPEIAGAKVMREFPGDLVIEIAVRRPDVWIACDGAGVEARDPASGLVVDANGLLFPCPRGTLESAAELPVIELRGEGPGVVAGEVLEHPDYQRAMRLMRVARKHLPEAPRWIESIRMHKSWGCRVSTRDGIEATFGHMDLDRQMKSLLAAVEHAREQGDRLATISLVPKRNLPVTFHNDRVPRAIVVPETEPETPRQSDLRELLDR